MLLSVKIGMHRTRTFEFDEFGSGSSSSSSTVLRVRVRVRVRSYSSSSGSSSIIFSQLIKETGSKSKQVFKADYGKYAKNKINTP